MSWCSPRALRPLAFLTCFAVTLIALWSCAGTGSPPMDVPGDLLIGKRPHAASGVTHVERITDGVVAEPGDHWRTDRTSVVRSSRAYAIYDLGESKTISHALVQGDANDRYTLSISEDGTEYTKLWDSAPIRQAGMRTRTTEELTGKGRFLKITASGGDGFYSIGELAVFSKRPAEWPPSVTSVAGDPLEERAQTWIWYAGWASILFALLNHKNASRRVRALAIAPVLAGIIAAIKLAELWPFEETEQSVIRAVVAAIAAVFMIRSYFSPPDRQASPRFANASLGMLAVIAIGCFYHFGMPQFRDEAQGRRSFVHFWDMRVYFPVAKYFEELRFDGLYLASVAAYLDNNPKLSTESVANVKLRDLNNNKMLRAGEVMGDIQAVRTRFAPQRWDLFKKDMKYFIDAMGPGNYLGSLQDHGGNATPVWILVAHLIFRNLPANELTLSLAGLIDPLLLIGLLVAVYRTFGLRTMLVMTIVFGATDFYRFGTNLMGSTMRLDWIVAIGLGVCALRAERWVLGGVLLAYGGLIRAFPEIAVIFLTIPALFWLAQWVREHKRLPSYAQIKAHQMPLLRTMFGVALCAGTLIAASSVAFTFQGSWVSWIEKIKIHVEKPNTNHIGLRNVLAFDSDLTGKKLIRPEQFEPWADWQHHQITTFERRKPIYYAIVVASIVAAVAACRKRRLEQAALIGTLLIPMLFYAANYYYHFVFLLPLIGASEDSDRKDTLFGWISLVLFGMSVAQYPTLKLRWGDVCYTQQSYILLIGFAAMLATLVWSAWPELAKNRNQHKPLADTDSAKPA